VGWRLPSRMAPLKAWQPLDPLHLRVDSRRASTRRQRRPRRLLHGRLPSRLRPERPQDGSGLFLAAVPQRLHEAPQRLTHVSESDRWSERPS
jgi:hypothetical protein